MTGSREPSVSPADRLRATLTAHITALRTSVAWSNEYLSSQAFLDDVVADLALIESGRPDSGEPQFVAAAKARLHYESQHTAAVAAVTAIEVALPTIEEASSQGARSFREALEQCRALQVLTRWPPPGITLANLSSLPLRPAELLWRLERLEAAIARKEGPSK